jgi:signal transduction histidine kinase
VYEERDRIARDLHDLVIQRLFATGMALEGTSRLIESPKAAARVMRAVDDLDRTIKEIRSTIFALQTRDESGIHHGLRAQVNEIIDEAALSLGFAPSLRMQGLLDTRVPDPTGEHVLAVLREALSNVVRHAKATQVDVEIAVDRDLVLSVRDNGVGIRDGMRNSGLANLEARAKELDGTFTVGSAADGGTVLRWQVPLDTGE